MMSASTSSVNIHQRLRPIRLSAIRDYGILALVVVLFVALSVGADGFFTSRNLFNIVDQNAPLALLALGTTFVMISGAFDLSCGQLMSFAGVVATQVTYLSGNPLLGLVAGMAIGAPIGAVNGLIVSRLNSFLSTLSTGLVLSGLALWVTQTQLTDLSMNTTFTWIGQRRFGAVPVSALILLLTFASFSAILHLTRTGRQMYAVGSNQEAARLSGISLIRLRTTAYLLGGLAASIAGVLFVSRTGVGRVVPDAKSLTLNAIAAVVIGGTSIAGGKGAMWRTLIGVLLLALLQNAFNLIGVAPYWQTVVTGLVILLAIASNAAAERTG
jgi:ribose transport system permease protein